MARPAEQRSSVTRAAPAQRTEAVCHLEWDSQCFELPVGRLLPTAISSTELVEALSTARQAGLRLLYWTTPDAGWCSQPLIAEWGGRLVDRRVTYSAATSSVRQARLEPPVESIQIRSWPAGAASPELLALGLEAGASSRFRLDPQMPNGAFERLYTQWTERSARREIADELLVAETRSGELAGFVTIARQGPTGVIGLIAVSAQARGRQVGRSLTAAAADWTASQRLPSCRVVTQFDNEAACRLYRSSGYLLATLEYTFHFWLS